MDQEVEVQKNVVEPEILDKDEFSLCDLDGKAIPIPKRLPWGKEKKILGIVGLAFEKVVPKQDDKSKAFDPSAFLAFVEENTHILSDEGTDLAMIRLLVDKFGLEASSRMRIDATEILRFFANEAPELITKLVSIITGKSESDVDNEFDGESVLQFAIPYIMFSIKKYMSSFTQSTAGAGSMTVN
jgi:hypothetical protein